MTRVQADDYLHKRYAILRCGEFYEVWDRITHYTVFVTENMKSLEAEWNIEIDLMCTTTESLIIVY